MISMGLIKLNVAILKHSCMYSAWNPMNNKSLYFSFLLFFVMYCFLLLGAFIVASHY